MVWKCVVDFVRPFVDLRNSFPRNVTYIISCYTGVDLIDSKLLTGRSLLSSLIDQCKTKISPTSNNKIDKYVSDTGKRSFDRVRMLQQNICLANK